MRVSLKNIIKNIFFLFVFLLVINRFIAVSYQNIPTTIGVVTSSSMEPVLHKGDIVLWYPVDPKTVSVGDVIVFQSYIDPSRTITHRVTEIRYDNEGNPYFLTKGDANPYIDQEAPTAVEKPVSGDHFRGKILSISQRPIGIPYLGDIFIFITHYLAGEMITFPWQSFLFLGILLFGIGIAMYTRSKQEQKKDDIKRITNIFFGPEKVSIRAVITYSIVIFTVILLLSTFTFHDVASVSIGVGMSAEKNAEVRYDRMKPGTRQSQDMFIVAPGTPIRHKIVVYPSEDISQYVVIKNDVIVLERAERYSCEVDAVIPPATPDGRYNGEIYVYSSPFWRVLPDSFMKTQLHTNPGYAVLYFDILSAVVLTVITVILLFGASIIIDVFIVFSTNRKWISDMKIYKRSKPPVLLIWKRRLSRIAAQVIRISTGWIKNIDWIDIRPKKPILCAFIGLVFLPLTFIGMYFSALILSAVIAGITAYFVGCRWRAEIILSGISSPAFLLTIVGIYTAIVCNIYGDINAYIGFLTNLGTALVLFYLIVFIPCCFLSYMFPHIFQLMAEKKDPFTKLEVGDI